MTTSDSSDPNQKTPDDVRGAYCRALETYLCRKNDGHLIRLVGPAFEQVCGWSNRGIPLKLAIQGVDRYFDRYYAKGPRRRPVRIEFCEADVLDVFDEWRRSVGVSGAASSAGSPDDGETGAPTRAGARSLPSHLERVIARLTTLRGSEDRTLDSTFDDIVRELDAVRATARHIRGDAREALLDRLRALDVSLVDAVRAHCAEATLRQLATEAAEELQPFRGRLAPAAYQDALRACIDRLLRHQARLPTIAYE